MVFFISRAMLVGSPVAMSGEHGTIWKFSVLTGFIVEQFRLGKRYIMS